MADLTEAQIREILAGCDGVTPGPWFCGCWSGRCHKQHRHTGPVGDDPCIYEPEKFDAYRADGIGAKEGRQVLSSSSDGIEISMADAAHIARLDPATVAALCNMALDRAAAEAKIAEQAEEIERLTKIASVLGQWGFENSTLGQVANLEDRAAHAGLPLEAIGRFTLFSRRAALADTKRESRP